MPKQPDSSTSNPSDNIDTKASSPLPERPDGAQAPARGRTVSPRKGQYMIAARRTQEMSMLGLSPLQLSAVEQHLRSNEDIEIVETVGPKNIVGMFADGINDVPSVLVARMPHEKANVLREQAQSRLIVEPDQPLNLVDVNFQLPPMVGGSTPATGPVLQISIIVLGRDNAPVKDAEVYLFGGLFPSTGVTDDRGQVSLKLYSETPQSIRGLYVKPKSDYWSFYQEFPDITDNEPNVVGLRPLSEWPQLANFPNKQVLGWGQKVMRLDQLPSTFRGQGIKVAVIDSGAATTHDDLRRIRFGFDVINKKINPNTWNEDAIAHGSHCAGIIAGADTSSGVRGFAPDAEVHVCKLFPGGQISQLIDALEYCIEKQIDVVNLSLGGAEFSEALEQQIVRAKRAGIACIVAAGNSGGRVQYPASSPNVLAVAAIGRINEFPPDSYHMQSVTQVFDPNGFYSAKFSCHGPEIAVCGPGVAIASSVPPNNYAVWDGTSMAAPHITGLAALVLAHHPDFQAAFKTRSAERVERLFQIIKLSARRVNVGDVTRSGYGLPDVLTALSLQPQRAPEASVGTQAVPQGVIGGAFGSVAGQGMMGQQSQAFMPASLNPFSYGYLGQISPASWGNPYLQGLSMASMDPGMPSPSQSMMPMQYPPGSMQGMPFGMQAGFVRQSW